MGRLSEVTTTIAGSPQTLAGAVTWRADGRLTGRSFGNGLRETRAYDTRGQLRTQQLGTEVTTYAYDPAGNLLSRSRPGADHDWDYDALDRVTGDRLDARERSYAYDANHNRLDALIEGLPEAYGYAPASNRLTAIATPTTSQTLTQDAAGNLLDDGAGQTYAYNQAGRLASAATAAGITRYRHSALGLRTHKAGAATTVFHHDAAGRLLAETTADGTPIRSYVWFGDEPLAQLDGPLGSETPTYLHTDHLATPRLGTDPAGIPVWRWESPAFGDAPPSLQLRTVNLRFPGQYYDAETGLHQNWHRDYDPRIGRYVQSDPIGLRSGPNTYAHVSNNPLGFIDPAGLSECRCTARKSTKEYPGPNGSDGIQNWVGRSVVQIRCAYDCKKADGSTETVSGTHSVGFWFEDGTELACIGVPYTAVPSPNHPTRTYIYEDLDAEPFDPEGSVSRELDRWAKEKCACGS